MVVEAALCMPAGMQMFSQENVLTGDETRNFVFWMAATGFLNFCLSYSIWANYGSPRCLTPHP